MLNRASRWSSGACLRRHSSPRVSKESIEAILTGARSGRECQRIGFSGSWRPLCSFALSRASPKRRLFSSNSFMRDSLLHEIARWSHVNSLLTRRARPLFLRSRLHTFGPFLVLYLHLCGACTPKDLISHNLIESVGFNGDQAHLLAETACIHDFSQGPSTHSLTALLS